MTFPVGRCLLGKAGGGGRGAGGGRGRGACNKLKNPNLTAAVRLFFSRQFTVKTFPYMEALKAWRAAAAKRGRYTGTGHK